MRKRCRSILRGIKKGRYRRQATGDRQEISLHTAMFISIMTPNLAHRHEIIYQVIILKRVLSMNLRPRFAVPYTVSYSRMLFSVI